jgi:hypothetical protein
VAALELFHRAAGTTALVMTRSVPRLLSPTVESGAITQHLRRPARLIAARHRYPIPSSAAAGARVESGVRIRYRSGVPEADPRDTSSSTNLVDGTQDQFALATNALQPAEARYRRPTQHPKRQKGRGGATRHPSIRNSKPAMRMRECPQERVPQSRSRLASA